LTEKKQKGINEGEEGMLDKRKIRMLELLDKQVMNCTCISCGLKKNGTVKPFWTPNSKFAIITEAPGFNEIRRQVPFSGQVGKILTDELSKVGFKADDLFVINTVQCKPTINGRNVKPSEVQMRYCQSYIRKYLKVINPYKILCLGNYAKFLFTEKIGGITGERGEFRNFKLEGSNKEYPVLFTFHPAYCIYNEEGLSFLKQDVKLFKDKEFNRNSDWFLTEEEFLI
jgi:uracil-DNA glycosylase